MWLYKAAWNPYLDSKPFLPSWHFSVTWPLIFFKNPQILRKYSYLIFLIKVFLMRFRIWDFMKVLSLVLMCVTCLMCKIFLRAYCVPEIGLRCWLWLRKVGPWNPRNLGSHRKKRAPLSTSSQRKISYDKVSSIKIILTHYWEFENTWN